MWHMSYGWTWSMFLAVILMVGFWVAVIWSVLRATRRPSTSSIDPHAHPGPTARQILERRFASGELTDEEFEAKKRRLIQSGREAT